MPRTEPLEIRNCIQCGKWFPLNDMIAMKGGSQVVDYETKPIIVAMCKPDAKLIFPKEEF